MRKVVFILSTNYAGSHLLSQLLGAHSECRSVGELHNLLKYLTRKDSTRDVDNEYATHPAFDGLAKLEPTHWHLQVFANLAPNARVSTLVDNSKRPEWARRFLANGVFECRYVHLLRDPRALVWRWLSTYSTSREKRRQRIRLFRAAPRLLATALSGDDTRVYTYKWLVANERITEFLAGHQSLSSIVTYCDIATDTDRTLTNLMPRLGLEFEPTQLAFGTAMSGTSKRRYAAQMEDSLIARDTRWRDELATKQVEAITSNRDVGRYLGSLGLEMTSEGLSRVAS